MYRISPPTVTIIVSALLLSVSLPAQQGQRGGGAGAPNAAARILTIEERTIGMQKIDGYFPLYFDDRTGNLWLEIPKFDSEFLYATGLAAGLGSNDIGLDRGQEGGGRLVEFQRVGPRVLLVQPNESFRSSSSNPAERKSVADSFAQSVLWGFAVGAESNGHVLVDATDFFIRDGHGAGNALAGYRVDRTRSALYPARTKGFPKNTEIEVTLTFTNETVGGRGGGAGGPAQGPPRIVVPTGLPAPVAAGGRGGGGGFGGGLFAGTIASVTPKDRKSVV